QAIGEDRDIDDDHDGDDAHNAADQPVVAVSEPFEAPVEGPEETADRALPPRHAGMMVARFEQQGAHGRRQRQRHDQGDHGSAGDGERELAVELARNAGNERRGDEHGAEHKGDGDQRGADLVHALVRRRARIEAGFDIPLDVLHHDNGIVDDDADREHEPEQRKVVQRKAEYRHDEEGPDQRYRNGNDRNDGGAPGLQEQDHHQYDEDHRLQDGLADRADGLLNELGRVVDDRVLDARRKALRELIHGGDDAVRRRQRVRARPLEDREGHRGIAIEIGIGRVILPGKLDARHVAQANHGGGGLLDQDVVELVGIGQASQRLHRDLKGALLRARRLVEDPGTDPDRLTLQSNDDVVRGQVQSLQTVGIDPDAHRVVATAEHRDRADAVDAGEDVGDCQRGIIGDEQAVARLVG